MWLSGTVARLLIPEDTVAPLISHLHRQAHGIATEIVELHSTGKTVEAKRRLTELYSVRDELISHLENLLSQ